jgi:hypothetical protein
LDWWIDPTIHQSNHPLFAQVARDFAYNGVGPLDRLQSSAAISIIVGRKRISAGIQPERVFGQSGSWPESALK